jgi:hypothetical protein
VEIEIEKQNPYRKKKKQKQAAYLSSGQLPIAQIPRA